MFECKDKKSIYIKVLVLVLILRLYSIIQIQKMKKVKHINVKHSNEVLGSFGVVLIILQIILIIAGGIFIRVQPSPPADLLDAERETAYQGINIMILIGFGYLMTVLKTNNLSSLIYTFFLNALVIQIYILVQGFWGQIFSGFTNNFYIYIDSKLLIKASYCVVSCLISLGPVIGRVSPTDLIKLTVVFTATYSLNQTLVYNVIGTYDAGGSSTIHIFGAYFGLAMSYMLGKFAVPTVRPQKNYYSNVLALIGTLFLWIYWPSFNFGVYSSNSFERTQIVTNTIFALTGSTIGTFVVTSMFGRGILVQDIQHASLAGGVAIGASSGILYLPPIALAIGFIAGIISANAFHYGKRLEKNYRIFDFHGVNNTHGIPGIFGGVVSGIIILFYNSGFDRSIANNYGANSIFTKNTNFLQQGGIQMASVGISFVIAIISGIITGKFISLFYGQTEDRFFQDCAYFDRNLFVNSENRTIKFEETQTLRNIPFTSERIDRDQKEREQPSQYKKPTPRKSKKQIKPN